MNLPFQLPPDTVRRIALELTAMESVVGTPGERRITDAIKERLHAMPWFKDHPESIITAPLEGDPLKREAVLVLLKGAGDPDARETVVLIGHTDTVGVEDYGTLKPWSTQPALLATALKEMPLPKKVEEDLASGDYLFGRGLLDMKTGVAAILTLLQEAATHRSALKGHVLAAFVPDEEGGSKGMLAAVSALAALQRKENLELLAMLDTDYTSPRHPEDPCRYLYAGTVGKIMPAFYVTGKETHVGDPFGGLDAAALSAAILEEIDLNPAYADDALGEVAVPPIALRLQDLKEAYSVQSLREAWLYFSVATHRRTPDQVLAEMARGARIATDRVLHRLEAHHRAWQRLQQKPENPRRWPSLRIRTYEELHREVAARMPDLPWHMDAFLETLRKSPDLEEREAALAMVRELTRLHPDKSPAVVVFFTPPYYPHIAVGEDAPKSKALLTALSSLGTEADGHPLVLKRFYPFISDLSYAAAPPMEAKEALVRNMPGFGVTYTLPLSDMEALSLPVANIGPYGHDAHQFTERLDTCYGFKVFPELLLGTVMRLLTPALSKEEAQDPAVLLHR